MAHVTEVVAHVPGGADRQVVDRPRLTDIKIARRDPTRTRSSDQCVVLVGRGFRANHTRHVGQPSIASYLQIIVRARLTDDVRRAGIGGHSIDDVGGAVFSATARSQGGLDREDQQERARSALCLPEKTAGGAASWPTRKSLAAANN